MLYNCAAMCRDTAIASRRYFFFNLKATLGLLYAAVDPYEWPGLGCYLLDTMRSHCRRKDQLPLRIQTGFGAQFTLPGM